ncbi:HTH-type transcriptional activator Btr [compost metagenome]
MPIDQDVSLDGPLTEAGTSTRANLDKVREYMEHHYNEQLSIGQLAQLANITPKYFVDLFKKTYGQSAMDFVTDLRINRAKRYLQESEEKLRDIALMVGYKDEFYFSRKFKKEVGVSPSEYIKNSRRRVAATSPAIIGYLLTLGIVPAAAPLDSKWTAYYYNAYRTEVRIPLKLSDPYTDVKFEENLVKLTQARPDAIIGTDQLSPPEREKLMEIAPSCFVSGENGAWRDQLRVIAQFLSREEQAEKWIRQYEQRAKTARLQITEVLHGDKIMVLRIYGDGIYFYWNRGFEDVMHHDLMIEPQYMSEHRRKKITMEELANLDPDRILIMICPEASSRAYWLGLMHSQAWNQLRAVMNRYVYTIQSDPWVEYSSVAIARMLDEALLLFTGNCPNAFQDSIHGYSG